jgi:hypothetical protein
MAWIESGTAGGASASPEPHSRGSTLARRRYLAHAVVLGLSLFWPSSHVISQTNQTRAMPAGIGGTNADLRYVPTPGLPNKTAIPGNAPPAYAPPAARQYPPSWYYNPYTQGIVLLPQGGGE